MNDNANKIETAVREAVQNRETIQKSLETIFIEAFALQGGTPDAKANDPGYQAWGLMGVDVAVRLARMFLGIKNNTGTYEIVCDLTYELNSNDFWQKSASIIMPLIHMALNSHRDGAILIADRVARNEYSSSDALISASRAAPLEIFSIIAYIVGGPQLMVSASLELKQKLAPYFL